MKYHHGNNVNDILDKTPISISQRKLNNRYRFNTNTEIWSAVQHSLRSRYFVLWPSCTLILNKNPLLMSFVIENTTKFIGFVYKRSKLIITVSANVMVLDGARPSVGRVLAKALPLDIASSAFQSVLKIMTMFPLIRLYFAQMDDETMCNSVKSASHDNRYGIFNCTQFYVRRMLYNKQSPVHAYIHMYELHQECGEISVGPTSCVI